MKKSLTKKTLTILTLAVITLAVLTACVNPWFPGAKKPVDRGTDEILAVSITAAFQADGKHVTLTADVTGSDGGIVSYQWYSNTVYSSEGGTALPGETSTTYAPPVDEVGTMYYYVEVTNILKGKTFNAVSNTIGIIVHANGDVEIIGFEVETPVVTIAVSNDGATVTLTAAASVSDGGTLSYQWYANMVDYSDGGAELFGETTTTYTPPVNVDGTTYYYVKATNTLGGQTASASSHTVKITIQDGEIIEVLVSDTVETPVVTITAESDGGNVTLTATAMVSDGGTLSYQWYKNTFDGSRGGSPIAGATGTSYAPTVGVDGTTYYYVKAANNLKGQTASAVSNTVKIVVREGEIVGEIIIDEIIVSAPVEIPVVSITANVDSRNVMLTATASVGDGGALTYQWYKNTVNNSRNGSLIAGATGTTYAPPTVSPGTIYYYVRVTNNLKGQTAGAVSDVIGVVVHEDGEEGYEGPPVEIIVPEPPAETPVVTITASPSGTHYAGSTVTLTAAASVNDGGTLSYQWYRNNQNNRNGTLINGATGTSYAPPTTSLGTTYYYVRVTNTLNEKTASAVSNVVQITVTAREISRASVTVTAPVKSATPHTQAAVNDTGYTPGTVEWSSNGTAVTGSFLGGTVYAAKVTLTAHQGYAFAANFTAAINGTAATVSERSAGTVTLSLTFSATLNKNVDSVDITTQPKLEYTYGETLDLSGLKVKVTYDDSSTDEGTLAVLSAPDKLGTNISADPANGEKLFVMAHNGSPVVVTVAGETADTNNLTVHQKQLTFIAAHTKVYDGATAANDIMLLTLNGVLFTDDVTVVPSLPIMANGTYVHQNAGTTTLTIENTENTSVTLEGVDADNYSASLGGDYTVAGITKATPTLNLNGSSRFVHLHNPPFRDSSPYRVEFGMPIGEVAPVTPFNFGMALFSGGEVGFLSVTHKLADGTTVTLCSRTDFDASQRTTPSADGWFTTNGKWDWLDPTALISLDTYCWIVWYPTAEPYVTNYNPSPTNSSYPIQYKTDRVKLKQLSYKDLTPYLNDFSVTKPYDGMTASRVLSEGVYYPGNKLDITHLVEGIVDGYPITVTADYTFTSANAGTKTFTLTNFAISSGTNAAYYALPTAAPTTIFTSSGNGITKGNVQVGKGGTVNLAGVGQVPDDLVCKNFATFGNWVSQMNNPIKNQTGFIYPKIYSYRFAAGTDDISGQFSWENDITPAEAESQWGIWARCTSGNYRDVFVGVAYYNR